MYSIVIWDYRSYFIKNYFKLMAVVLCAVQALLLIYSVLRSVILLIPYLSLASAPSLLPQVSTGFCSVSETLFLSCYIHLFVFK